MNLAPLSPQARPRFHASGGGPAFTAPDLLVVMAGLALLAAIAVPVLRRASANSEKAQCNNNLRQVNRAVLMYADEHRGILPMLAPSSGRDTWWWYKELVKSYVGLLGPSSPGDRVFACPNDRGYDAAGPFCRAKKFDYQSYVFNGVNMPGLPNIAGWPATSVKTPSKTLLTMEWSAHAPLSWHNSRTGDRNHPFYNNAQSMVGFVDGHVAYIRIYYDGVNAAYTRDPLPGFEYRYSGD